MRKTLVLSMFLTGCAGVSPFAIGESAGNSAAFTHQSNTRRTGYSGREFKPPYRLRWQYQARHSPRPAWPEPAWEVQRIDFDYALPVTADGERAYVSSSADHTVRALRLDSGEEAWAFFTGGPVRLAPTVHNGRVYFSADDGRAYCLDAASGKTIWQFQPEIADRRLIGNGQMVSRWASRSGVLVNDGKAYVAFGMWPDGVFLYCLEAQTGDIVWRNDTSGIRFMTLPHYRGMGGVSPQGYLALAGSTLVVPCGRATPALFDARNGRLIYHEAEGLFPGGAWTMTFGDLIFTRCEEMRKPDLHEPDPQQTVRSRNASLVALDATTGKEVFHCRSGSWGVISDQGILTVVGGDKLISIPLASLREQATRKSIRFHVEGRLVDIGHKGMAVDPIHALLQAGDTLMAGHNGRIACYDAQSGQAIWQHAVQGEVRCLALGGDVLMAATTEGHIYCFEKPGKHRTERPQRVVAPKPARPLKIADTTANITKAMRSAVDIREGYALVLAKPEAGLLPELAKDTELTLYQVATAAEAEPLRRRLEMTGLYGPRIAVHAIEADILPYTDFFVVYAPGSQAFDLTTGQALILEDPLTGKGLPGYYGLTGGGCGKLVGSTHLLMIRSGGLGFYDLRRPAGTFQYSGVRGSCFVNTIAANGLVLTPDGSAACSCAYSYRTSLALAPSNRQNHWGIMRPLTRVSAENPLREMRVNFAAPGDRTDEEGNIWYAWPRPSTAGPRGAGGMNRIPAAVLPLEMQSSEQATQPYARNPDTLAYHQTPRAWLYSYGFSGPLALTLDTGGDPHIDRTYRIRIHYAAPPGRTEERICRVRIQHRTIIARIHARQAADRQSLSSVIEAPVNTRSAVTIAMEPVDNKPMPIICGI
jgi:outer membrane protein assembly factor BamB